MQKARLNIQLFGSGTIDGSSTASNCDCRIVWNSTKIDSDNSSLVKMTTQIKKSGSSSTTGTFSGANIIDGTEFSVSKKATWAWGDWRTVATSSKTVKHNDDGTKQISISTLLTQTGTSMAGTYRASGTITLDTINRASKLQSISNFDLNDTVIIGINKYVTSAVDTLQIKIGDTLIREVTNIANGYELTFSDTEKTTINSLATNPQVSLIFLLTTVNDGTTLGTSTQSVLVTLLDKSMFREIYKKENGKYQVAINGFVNTEINDVLQVYDDEGNEILNGKVLYDNSTGTNGTVTLSDSAANYEYVDIFYRDNDDTYSSVRVYNPDGKNADISTIERWGNTLYIKQKRITISGNQITNGNRTEANFTTAPKIGINTNANNIYITKVIGYHDTPKQVYTIPMSDMYYKPGDVYTITDRAYITVGGSLTASKGQVRFGVFLPKLLTNINSVTVSLAKLTIRNTSGSYIIDYKDVTSELSASKSGDNTVYLSYGASSMSGTNNTPVSVEINALKLTFN